MLPPGASGRVIAIFGSAGLRDVDKRRMMAETSAQLADLTILTEDVVSTLLAAVGAHGTVVWLAGPEGDEALARELGSRLARSRFGFYPERRKR